MTVAVVLTPGYHIEKVCHERFVYNCSLSYYIVSFTVRRDSFSLGNNKIVSKLAYKYKKQDQIIYLCTFIFHLSFNHTVSELTN
jgi:hypothetical protein